jgi:hypothetical protein
MDTRGVSKVEKASCTDGQRQRGFLLAMFVGIILLFPVPSTAWADVFRYVDDQGVTHFTNVPDNRKFKLWIREKRVLLKPGLGNVNYDAIIAAAAERHKVDNALIKAVIKAESNFDHRAVSPKGAQGLMQLMPQTASNLQVRDSFEPEANIEGGVRYLRYLINVYGGDLRLALAAYNAGEKAVAKHRGIPPFAETRTYVRHVLDLYDRFSRKEPDTKAPAPANQKPSQTNVSYAQDPGRMIR